MEKVEICENWITDYLDGWNYSNKSRYYNYLAIVHKDDDGNYNYEWLKESTSSDEYFNVNKVKVGDILMAGSKDKRKNRGCGKFYYGVVAKDDNSMTLVKDTTYLQVKKELKNIQKDLENQD